MRLLPSNDAERAATRIHDQFGIVERPGLGHITRLDSGGLARRKGSSVDRNAQDKRAGYGQRKGTTNCDLHDGTPVGVELQERNRIHFVGVNGTP
ncbi:hypothetical protein ACJ6WI_01985 [Stenotrophomonas maltophilia]|uniref:hypothetical protein n=1 Tax=Stenotrophomonas TaxID=40323 RepID=UPI0012FC300C|nr:hypothetical protein [Stenotrophomonas sp. SKA14]